MNTDLLLIGGGIIFLALLLCLLASLVVRLLAKYSEIVMASRVSKATMGVTLILVVLGTLLILTGLFF